jgi:hypothetical protein
MRTRRNRCTVSVGSQRSGVRLAAVLITASALAACAGRQHPVVQTQRATSADRSASLVTDESRMEALQFDNQANTYVDVYLVGMAGGQIQWRLGRVSPGMRASLRVPQSAIDWTEGFVRLAVIPGSQVSAEVWRDPRAITAIAQPLSELLSQRWTFRQPAGTPLQLQATRLPSR